MLAIFLEKIKELRGMKRVSVYTLVVSYLLLVLGFGTYNLFFSPPKDFPTNTITKIQEGTTGKEAARQLAENSVIRSSSIFQIFVALLGDSRGILYGEYYFEEPKSVFHVAKRLTRGEFGLTPIRITIPEGATVQEMGIIIDRELPSFKSDTFSELAQEHEGFLFPDTYFFLPGVEPERIIKEMRKNFDRKISSLDWSTLNAEYSTKDVIIMASILEKEALTIEDKEMIAGILWKRLEIGMPLQVDAPFVYSIGKNTYELSTKDLREDAPYNTYTRKGLPPTPIANPGIESIEAALNPEESPYLFYLSDKEGNMHYAENFEQHKRNKYLHLN